MNPSATDWIPKFLNRFDKAILFDDFKNEEIFYQKLKNVGFIYGVSMTAIPDEKVSHLKLTRDEFTKINLLHAMLFTYFQEHQKIDYKEAIASVIDFYSTIEKGKPGFLKKLRFSNNPANNLEQIFSARLNETNSIFKKNSSMLITYALLYVDVIAFRVFLKAPKDLKEYIQELESTILSCSFLALTS